MGHLLLSAAMAAPLVALLFPLLGDSRPEAVEDFTNATVRSGHGKSRNTERFGGPSQWSEDEFAFGRAIEAYADLIDATARRLK
jgi:hypothetical protein